MQHKTQINHNLPLLNTKMFHFYQELSNKSFTCHHIYKPSHLKFRPSMLCLLKLIYGLRYGDQLK